MCDVMGHFTHYIERRRPEVLGRSALRGNRQTGVSALFVTAALTVLVWACAALPARAQADKPGIEVDVATVEATHSQAVASNSAHQSQTNQLAGRDSTASGAGGGGPGGGDNATGVCNSAAASHQCEQTNVGLIAQTATATGGGVASNSAHQSQTNQLAGRDTPLVAQMPTIRKPARVSKQRLIQLLNEGVERSPSRR
jgi:hypothetical protein